MGSNIELKRAEFRKYLERSGVVEALTRALIALYSVEDKPEDPVAFVKNNLMEHDADANALLDELEGALHRVEELEQELMKLQEAAGLPPDINIPMTPGISLICNFGYFLNICAYLYFNLYYRIHLRTRVRIK